MFLPEEKAEELRVQLWYSGAQIAQVKLQAAEAVVQDFESIYPGRYTYVWRMDVDKVNCRASPPSPPTITIYGGLLKHPAVGAECFALMLSHEIGHYDTSVPTKNGLACEGYADYVGVRFVLRDVYGSNYERIVGRAIPQVRKFLKPSGTPNGSTSCATHPDEECRMQTFIAAANGCAMPTCAQLPIPRTRFPSWRHEPTCDQLGSASSPTIQPRSEPPSSQSESEVSKLDTARPVS
jgi:hypothetical protein